MLGRGLGFGLKAKIFGLGLEANGLGLAVPVLGLVPCGLVNISGKVWWQSVKGPPRLRVEKRIEISAANGLSLLS